MDTIVAYSGGTLPCAIGIVRLSGENAVAILNKLFKAKQSIEHKKMTYGTVIGYDGKAVDLCLATVFTNGKSYTGEDMAEIYCHGSQAVVKELLRTAQFHGARLAQAGEFTKRAFLNRKLDLTSAEAVGDLIHATSIPQAKAAVSQLQGGIFKVIMEIYQDVTGILSHFYAVCDYTDEDIEPWQYDEAVKILVDCILKLEKLYDTFEKGDTIKNGLPCAIIGRPNAGKSSLLNGLLGYDRAIVTDEEGTTRDTIESVISIKDTVLRLVDTAGIREGESQAERMGIERSIAAAKEAKLVICVIDGSREYTGEDLRAISVARNADKSILVFNKSDLGNRITETFGFDNVFYISAVTGDGLEDLTDYLGSLVQYNDNETLITNARQAGLLFKAINSFKEAEMSARMGQTADAFLIDAEAGIEYIGEILGKNPTVDVVNEIFSKFCVGK